MSSALSCLAQLDCSGHMNYTLQHVQLSSTLHHAHLYPSSMMNSAYFYPSSSSAQIYPPACSIQLSFTPAASSAQLNTSSVNTGLVVQVKPASSTRLHLIPRVLYGRSICLDSTRLVRMSCTLVHARPYRKHATHGRL